MLTHPVDRRFFRDFEDSPDPRFRRIIRRFAEAGFLEAKQDEWA